MNPPRNVFRILAVFVFAVLVGGFVLFVYLSKSAQWDFEIPYTAAQAYKQGLDPYDVNALTQVCGHPMMPYVYPPHVLYIFRPFTWLPFHVAASVYLTMKLLAVWTLVILWRRMFRLETYGMLFLFFVPFAFEGALLADLRCGNCSVFEQLFIWTGFYFYLQGRSGLFCAAILCASCVKLVPLLLLGFLLTGGKWREVAWLAGSALVVVAAAALSAVIFPELSAKFLHNAGQTVGERGILNPSIWSLVRDASLWFQTRLSIAVPVGGALVVYAIAVATAVGVSATAFYRGRAGNKSDWARWRICLTCLLYAIIVPRFKDYSYILLIGPAFFVLAYSCLPNALLLGCALVMISTHSNFLDYGKFLEPLHRTQMEYYPLALAGLIWGLCCYTLLAKKNVVAASASAIRSRADAPLQND